LSSSSFQSYAIIDADAHVCETERTWEYLAPKDRGFRPEPATLPGGRDVWIIDGRIAGLRHPLLSKQALDHKSAAVSRNLAVPAAAFALEDVGLRIKHMDDTGTDVQVLHNTFWIEPVTDRADIQAALCRSWNRWMAEVWSESNNRLRWTCVVPTSRPEEALTEMLFCKERGAVGVCLRPFEGDVLVIDEEFIPIFQAAADVDLTVTIHIANGSQTLTRLLAGRGQSLGGFVTLGLPTIEACWALLISDVPKRFPTLRWAFVEASAGWIPWMIHGLRRKGQGVPADPFTEFGVFVTSLADEDHEHILKYVSEDVLMLGTDYGHVDYSGQVDALQLMASNESLSQTVRRKILSENPRRAYGISETELQALKRDSSV
jgi:uncharacterized protein